MTKILMNWIVLDISEPDLSKEDGDKEDHINDKSDEGNFLSNSNMCPVKWVSMRFHFLSHNRL
jgi:hypothetical protein